MYIKTYILNPSFIYDSVTVRNTNVLGSYANRVVSVISMT